MNRFRVGPGTHDDKLRARLLQATIERVDQEGLAAVSLRQLAASVETSTSAVYSLFGNKDSLLQAVVEEGSDDLAQSQRAAADGGLVALAHAYRQWALSHPARYRLMLNGVLDEVNLRSAAVHEAADRALEPLTSLLTTLRPEWAQCAQPQALQIWAQLHGVVSLQLAGVVGTAEVWEQVHADLVDRLIDTWQAAEPTS